jgi:glycosyltransferase involved in cell wall biosynthesis
VTQIEKKKDLKILVIEPYYGGSHKRFLSGLRRLPFSFEFMTLPARKWKWRMRLAAPYFARRLMEEGKRFDRVLCSSFLDVAAFRGLAPQWVREVPLLTYFHENQFAYPVQEDDERDLHFALTNMTTALASDALAFNSRYNLRTFLDGTAELLRHSGDMKLKGPSEAIRKKSVVLPPGIDFTAIDGAKAPRRGKPPVILWNHRWEHDKNPELFFETLYRLDHEGLDFGLLVLGESFERRPPVFDEARERLSHRILHFGYVRSRREYARWLKKGDIVVSTALHEFFGIAVIEAVRAGARPLLPRRLSYTELFPEEFLYNDEDLADRLRDEVLKKGRLAQGQAENLTEAYSWEALSPAYESWIKDAQIP